MISAVSTVRGLDPPVPVAAGTVVVREGNPADRFYIIESGRFAVDQLDPGTRLPRRLRGHRSRTVPLSAPPLPASRKVRALFAYLALAPSAITRAALCASRAKRAKRSGSAAR